MPIGNGEFDLYFSLVNNFCFYEKNYNFLDGAPDYIVNDLVDMLSLTRNQTFDYSDAIIQKYSTGTIASNEISSNNYLNKGFNNSRFVTSEVPGISSAEIP